MIAFIEGQGAVIGIPPEGLDKMDVSGTEIVVEDSPDLPSLWKAFGASKRADGHWILPPLTAELASPDAALHIGPQHVLLETAATELAAELAGTPMVQVTSWHVMFMARGKVGPFRVEGTAYHGAPGKVGVRVLIHDEGNGDRPVTLVCGDLRRAARPLTILAERGLPTRLIAKTRVGNPLFGGRKSRSDRVATSASCQQRLDR